MSNLEIVNVCKSYRHQEVLRNISLSLPQSSIALLGPNGAGKTTLLRILATLITPDSGIIRLGENEWKNRQEIRPLIGYLPQHFNFYPYLTVHECLEYIATLKNIGKNQLNTEVTRVIEEANLSDFSDKRIRSLSGGMLRRLGIAQALIASPRILLIDEPTAGLDPKECNRFRSCLLSQAEGKTTIISTHITQDVEAMCSYLAVLINGMVCYWGTTIDFIQTAEGYVMEESVSMAEADCIRARYYVIREQCHSSNDFRVRYLLDEERKNCVMPTLEDAYFLLMRKKGAL